MAIILPFSGGVIAYLAEIEKWLWTFSFSCPCCSSNTLRHGNYLRTVYDMNEYFVIPVFRRRCPNCGKTFSLIPCFIKPYARFLNSYRLELLQRHAVDGVSIKQTPAVSSSPAANTISTPTFRRWLNKIKGVAPEVNIFISKRLLELRPSLHPPKSGLSDVAFLLNAGAAFHLIAHSFLPELSLKSCGIFDVLNLILSANLWV